MKNEQKNAQDPVPENPRMPLTRRNYVLLAIGFAVVLLGFVLMAGGGSDSPDEFNYAMFSWRRITPGPDPRDRRFRHRDLCDHATLQVIPGPLRNAVPAGRPARQRPADRNSRQLKTLSKK